MRLQKNEFLAEKHKMWNIVQNTFENSNKRRSSACGTWVENLRNRIFPNKKFWGGKGVLRFRYTKFLSICQNIWECNLYAFWMQFSRMLFHAVYNIGILFRYEHCTHTNTYFAIRIILLLYATELWQNNFCLWWHWCDLSSAMSTTLFISFAHSKRWFRNDDERSSWWSISSVFSNQKNINMFSKRDNQSNILFAPLSDELFPSRRKKSFLFGTILAILWKTWTRIFTSIEALSALDSRARRIWSRFFSSLLRSLCNVCTMCVYACCKCIHKKI